MLFLIALLVGALSAFAFQPFVLWPLMPLAFAALAELVARAPSLRRALLLGWGFGVGQFCIGLNWIATAFTFQAAMPAWLGWIAVLLLALYLAVYPMLATGLAWQFGRASRPALVLALAGGWAISEWLRGKIFTGFAWNPVGVTLVDTPWRGAAAHVGTYGLSALVVLAGGAAWLAWRRVWKAAVAVAVPLLLVLTLPHSQPMRGDLRSFDVAAQASTASPGQQPAPGVTRPAPPLPPPPALAPAPQAPPPPPITPHSAFVTGSVRIVQPNIGQADKWREGFDRIASGRLQNLSIAPYGNFPPETVHWPEAAVTAPLLDERAGAAASVTYERLRAVRSIHPGQLLATGGLGLTSSDGMTVDGATNSVFVMDSAGAIVGRYDKAHLVPYGEYLPMRPILSAIGLSRLAPGDLDFRPGPGPRTLALPNGRKMGVQLCYEIIFSGEVVERGHRPDYIFNPSNDAWFGSWGPPQHLAQARLRAAEEALPVLRATPTGVSAVVDASGAIVKSVGAGEAQVIDAALPMPGTPTPFSRLGNVIPLMLGGVMLLLAIALDRRRRYSNT